MDQTGPNPRTSPAQHARSLPVGAGPGRAAAAEAGRRALGVTLAYAGLSLVWIWGSDRAVNALDLPPRLEILVESSKGTLFVLVTAWLLWAAVRRMLLEPIRANLALAESEERYREMFESNHAVKLLVDAGTGRILEANAAAAEFYGHARDRLLAMSIRDLNGMTDAELAERVARIQAGERQFEITHRLASGEARDMQVFSGPVSYRGRPALFSIIHDVTERNRARRALAESEERYRRIVETTREGVWLADASWRTTYVNARMAEMLGTTPEAMVGRPVDEFVHPRYAAELARNKASRESGEGEVHEAALRRADGSVLWARVSTNPLRGGPGAFAGALAMVTDNTARRAADALRDGQARVLEMVASGAPLPSVLEEIVRLAETVDPDAIGSILLLRPGGTMVTGAAPGLPAAYSRRIDGTRIGPGVGSCGTAMHERRRVVVEDIASSPLWKDFAALAAEHGLAACWSEPILGRGGEVLGSFATYFRTPRAPGGPQAAAIATAAHLAGIAIERARAEADLRDSERRLTMALKGGRMGIYDWDLATDAIAWSEEHARLWGMTLEEFDGTYDGFASRVHPDDLPRIDAAVRAAMAGDGSFAAEYRVLPAAGVVRWVAGRGQFEPGPDGRWARMRGVVMDVTDIRAAEEALRASEATKRALLEALPDTMFQVDREGRYLSYHTPDESRLLAPPERFLGRTAREVLPARLADLFTDALDRLFRTGHPQTYEYDYARPGGQTAWWEVRLVLSRPGEAMVLLRDITDRRAAERRLQENEQRLGLLVRSTPLGVVIFNTDFTVREWNPGAERLFGWPAAEAVGRHGSFIIPEHERRYVDQVWNALLSRTGGSRGTNQNVRSDGSTVVCEWYNSPLLDDRGRIFAVACVVEDVTEVRDVQRRQQLMMAELDHRVKNNLAAVLSLAEQTGRTSATYEDFLEKFMGRLHAMNRMHAALARSSWRGAELAGLVRQTLDAYARGPGRASADGPPFTLAPRAAQALAMAFNELATNAVKYGALSVPDGRVDIAWGVRPGPDGGERLEIRWAESGGPPVAPPSRRGFGSEMIEGAVAHELRGNARLDFRPDGLVCEMLVPRAAAEMQPEDPPSLSVALPTERPPISGPDSSGRPGGLEDPPVAKV